MAVSTGNYLKSIYDSSMAQGAKAISSDFTLAIDGFDDEYLLVKQAPWAELTAQGEIEVPLPLGSVGWQPQQVKTNQQGSIALYETVAGSCSKMLVDLLTRGGKYANGETTFDCWIYEGTPEHYLSRKRYRDCFLQLDVADRDWENRSQPLQFTGTLFFHYFGEDEAGNSENYR